MTPISTSPAEAPAGWRWVRLTDVARLESGHTPSRRRPDYWDGEVRWLSLKDIRGLGGRKRIYETVDRTNEDGIANSSARLLPAETVAFCRTASVGEAVILGREMATSQDFVCWVCGPSLVPAYLLAALRASEREFDRLKQGSTHKTIYMPIVEQFHVLVPESMAEQERIAAILDQADALRRKREQAIALTEDLLRSVFLEMFGDPVTNPKGWPVKPIGKLGAETQYGTSSSLNTDGRGMPVLRMNNITYEGFVDVTDLKTCEIASKDTAKYTVRRGDLLFNRTNSPELVGKTTVWDRDDAYAYAGYLIRVRFLGEKLHAQYVSAFLNSEYGKAWLRSKQKTSNNMSNFSATEFKCIEIPVAPYALQLRFAEVVEQLLTQRARLLDAKVRDAGLFASLQQRAFRGEMSI